MTESMSADEITRLRAELDEVRAELEWTKRAAEQWRTAKGFQGGPISTAADHIESICERCTGPNVVWSAPSPLWNEIMRGGSINGNEEHQIVCPTCFAYLAERRGVATLWKLFPERVYVELETVTPSGRVWNADTWMFEEPAVAGGSVFA